MRRLFPRYLCLPPAQTASLNGCQEAMEFGIKRQWVFLLSIEPKFPNLCAFFMLGWSQGGIMKIVGEMRRRWQGMKVRRRGLSWPSLARNLAKLNWGGGSCFHEPFRHSYSLMPGPGSTVQCSLAQALAQGPCFSFPVINNDMHSEGVCPSLPCVCVWVCGWVGGSVSKVWSGPEPQPCTSA